jgi:hypothetical protein
VVCPLHLSASGESEQLCEVGQNDLGVAWSDTHKMRSWYCSYCAQIPSGQSIDLRWRCWRCQVSILALLVCTLRNFCREVFVDTCQDWSLWNCRAV